MIFQFLRIKLQQSRNHVCTCLCLFVFAHNFNLFLFIIIITMNQPNLRRIPLADIYQNLYPWKNLQEFVKLIKSTIAYTSEDNSVIALNKPFGVGIYASQDKNDTKQNQDKLLYKLRGYPKYCIEDVLKPLSDELESPKPYKVLKGLDRYMSGLVLITNDFDFYRPKFLKSLAHSRCKKIPPYGLRAITSGYPTINSNKIQETIGVELIEVDDLGDYKEPIIVTKPSKRFFNKYEKNRETYQVEFEVKKTNREYSVALVELYLSNLKYDFARCYVSSKTSFILGDVRFSKRIREILGKPIQVSAFKSSHRYDDNYEPLNSKLQSLFGVYKNASIPLMLDLHAIRLKGFDRTRKSRDLFIQSPYMPVHFALTAKRLNLLD